MTQEEFIKDQERIHGYKLVNYLSRKEIAKRLKVSIRTVDVYRLSDSDEFYAIGGDEYFSTGICLIEWGEIIKDVLPENYIHITFEKDSSDENIRYIKIMH